MRLVSTILVTLAGKTGEGYTTVGDMTTRLAQEIRDLVKENYPGKEVYVHFENVIDEDDMEQQMNAPL
ncbi:hypothetical protein KKG24_04360 [Patescibacteria group bacterium]|nr:hypothetical protein [Patescibacteria group bacterium]